MEGIPKATNAGDVCAISRPMLSAARAVLTCGGSFLGKVRVVCQWNGQACRLWDGQVAACQRNGQVSLNAEAAHRLSVEWTGTPPAEWTGLIKCRGDTSPVTGMDRRRALSAINTRVA
jgi:hypothetical protein